MKTKKLTIKIINYITFLGYLAITLAFSSGVSDKNRDSQGHIKTTPTGDPFSFFYSYGWELAEELYLIELFFLIIYNMVSRERFKKTMVKFFNLNKNQISIIFSVFSFVLPLTLFILKLIFMNVYPIFIKDEFKIAIAFFRMFILYDLVIEIKLTFYFNSIKYILVSSTNCRKESIH